MDQKTLTKAADFKPAVLEAIEEGEYQRLTVWDLERLAAAMTLRPSQILSMGEVYVDKHIREAEQQDAGGDLSD